MELAVDALGGFGGATWSGAVAGRGQAELGDQGVRVPRQMLTKDVISHEFDGSIGRRRQAAIGSRRSQACFVVDGDTSGDALAQQLAEPLPHQCPLGIFKAVPADHLVGEALAAPAHQVAVRGGANADAGCAPERDG